jgi:hypothetical protein
MRTNIPGRLHSERCTTSANESGEKNIGVGTMLTTTYTVPSRTNMSCRGSFIRFLHSQSMRKPTLTGEFVAGSVDGRAMLWDLCEEKRSSRPPLVLGMEFRFFLYLMGMCWVGIGTYVNSSFIGIVDDIFCCWSILSILDGL